MRCKFCMSLNHRVADCGELKTHTNSPPAKYTKAAGATKAEHEQKEGRAIRNKGTVEPRPWQARREYGRGEEYGRDKMLVEPKTRLVGRPYGQGGDPGGIDSVMVEHRLQPALANPQLCTVNWLHVLVASQTSNLLARLSFLCFNRKLRCWRWVQIHLSPIIDYAPRLIEFFPSIRVAVPHLNLHSQSFKSQDCSRRVGFFRSLSW